MNTDFPLKAQDAIIGDVIIYPEMDMSRTGIAQHVLASVAARQNRVFSLRIAHILHC